MALLKEIKVPLISVNDTSLTVVEIFFSNGNYVKKEDIIMVFETSKTTYDVVAESNGYIQVLCEVGNDYEVNQIIAKIFSEQSEIQKINVANSLFEKPAALKQASSQEAPEWKGDTLFTPAAIVLMESSGVNHSSFTGKDFVSKYDVEEVIGLNGKNNSKIFKNENKLLSTTKPDQFIDVEKVLVEKLSSNKKREIEYLHKVQSTGLTSTINTVIETEGIFTNLNQGLKVLKNSLLPIIIYETARLLKKYKILNAYSIEDGIAFYKNVNIGFAIDINKGLKVMKIGDTSQKNIQEIENDIITLSNKYIDDNLKLEDLTDITFTITDLSSEDVTFFTPLVNMMNSAILGISSIDRKLNRCILHVTFDHRVTEGKLVAQFLKELKDRLESYKTNYSNLNRNISCSKCHKLLTEDLSDVGFAKCITPEGAEGFICQSCLKGF